MPMTEARAGDQAVRYDRQATAAYAGMKHGSPEKCGCVGEIFALGERNVNPQSRAEALRRLKSALLHRPASKDTRPR